MKSLKLLLIASLILVSGASQAQPHYWNHHHGYYHRHYEWVAPFVIGSALTYAITRPVIIIPKDPDIYVTNPDLAQPSIRYDYHYEQILDANCNCYRLVLVPNQP